MKAVFLTTIMLLFFACGTNDDDCTRASGKVACQELKDSCTESYSAVGTGSGEVASEQCSCCK